jgi:hypothetical protein
VTKDLTVWESRDEITGAADAGSGQNPARKRTVPVKPSDIVGLKYFDQLLPLLESLTHDGCTRDRAGNRELHYDQSCLLVLLCLFNPICSSLRAVQQASEIKKVQKRPGCVPASPGSRSEAATL